MQLPPQGIDDGAQRESHIRSVRVMVNGLGC
jgi:hypothetical protein